LVLFLACVQPHNSDVDVAAAARFVPDGIRGEVWRDAVTAWDCARRRNEVQRSTLAVVDWTLPSDQRRLWVVDLEERRTLHRELVAHGVNSGGRFVQTLSNQEGSRQSSVGVMSAAEIYTGKHGRSLRLDGLERGFNDAARRRAIVVHPARYVSAERAKTGAVGRSWGCLALPTTSAAQIIDAIADGGLVVAWDDDERWRSESRYLSCDR